VATKARLEGHPYDLRYLADLLPSGKARVAQDGDRFYLAAPEMENPPVGEQYHDVARRLITWANGLACVLNPRFAPVELTDAYHHDGGVSVVLGTAHVTIRPPVVSATGVVTNPDGYQEPPPPPPGPGYLALAAKDTDLAEVLKIMAGSPHFPELHKVLEIVESTGKRDAAMKSAGISKSQMSIFTQTANHQNASGDHSRHARSSAQPPANPMPIAEARAMTRSLVAAWIAALSAGQP
jgi:hypothetical protein